ncbi:MAG: multiheme c-type cytochrome [Pseudomonadota bacterium]
MQTGSFQTLRSFTLRWITPLFTAGCLVLACAGFPNAHALASTSPAPLSTRQSTWFVDMNLYSAAAHGSLKCEECHGPMIGKDTAGKNKTHPDKQAQGFLRAETRREFDYASCGKCHKTSFDRFMTGEHAKAMVTEKQTGKVSRTGHAPTCGDCHSAHFSPSHLSRAETGKRMTETCGSCHPSQKLSFLANYHGKAAVNLGYDRSALCTDCHGAHACLSLKEPKEVLSACRRCHPDAGPSFADIIIHDNRMDLDKKTETKQAAMKRVQFLGFLSFVFVTVLLVFFYGHSCLLMLRKLHEKLRKHN